VTFGVALLVIGGFLLGGSYSIFKADSDSLGRTRPQLVFAVVLLLAALISSVAGVLYLVS
jgi:type IV secretory pathway VirB3-like protein